MNTSKKINEYDAVEYLGDFDSDLKLPKGEIGYVLDDYGDGNFEVEFSFPDGTTWLQCALPATALRAVAPQYAKSAQTVYRNAVFSAVLQYEKSGKSEVKFEPTGEILQVWRDASNRHVMVSTPSLGTIVEVPRPKAETL